MTQKSYKIIHENFKLNGITLNKEALSLIAYSFIKEGNEFQIQAGNFILDWLNINNYIEVLTSGTTGKPKTIRIEKQAMVNSALSTGLYFDLKTEDKALNCLPVKYIAGKMMFVRAFVIGLHLDFVAPNAMPLLINEKIYDFVAMVPLQVENSSVNLNQIKTLIVGGAKINKALENKILNSECKVFETYSMTETVTHIAVKRVGERVFSILPNVSISQDNRNCLVISAPDLNVENLITNDVVKLVSNNQFIWLGRFDNVINSGGIKLFPEQIEEKIAKKIRNRLFVAGIPDEKLGEKLVLFVEGIPFEIENSVFDSLDKYEKPKEIKFIPIFEETETGKIKRKEILASILKLKP